MRSKLEKFKRCEQELKDKVIEMEDVFEILTQLKDDYKVEEKKRML